ncbi:MAG: hypothetical protein OIF58_09045, partial [Cohaesibacter sp.]|nr:hypothetical protein [Cohaesibacter sp.]
SHPWKDPILKSKNEVRTYHLNLGPPQYVPDVAPFSQLNKVKQRHYGHHVTLMLSSKQKKHQTKSKNMQPGQNQSTGTQQCDSIILERRGLQ